MARRKEGEKVELPHELQPTIGKINTSAPDQVVDESKAILEKEIESLRADSLDLKNQLVGLSDALKAKHEELDSCQKKCAFYKEELDQRSNEIAELSRKCNLPIDEELYEIVAIPVSKSVIVTPLTTNGKKAPSRVDEDGFWHFWVPELAARQLIADKGGMKYVLVGPDSVPFIDVHTMNGVYAGREKIFRHVKRRNSKGEASWIPTIAE